MQAICSYCELDMGEREPFDDPRLTHGMCQECFDAFDDQWSGEQLGEYLDRFEAPVVAVNADGRVIAINHAMGSLADVAPRAAVGLRGGEFLECVNARLPEGCGQTVHCSACTIREALAHTIDTGKPVERRPAVLTRQAGPVEMLISTTRQGEYVQLVIEELEG